MDEDGDDVLRHTRVQTPGHFGHDDVDSAVVGVAQVAAAAAAVAYNCVRESPFYVSPAPHFPLPRLLGLAVCRPMMLMLLLELLQLLELCSFSSPSYSYCCCCLMPLPHAL